MVQRTSSLRWGAGTAIVMLAAATCAAADAPDVGSLPDQKNLPDVMVMNDGTRVTTKEQWARRREEIKDLLQRYEYGHLPPPPGNVRAEKLQEAPVLDGKAAYQRIKLTFGPNQSMAMEVCLLIPAGAGPHPVIVYHHFQPNLVPADAARHEAVLSRGYALLAYNYQQAAADKKENRDSGFYAAKLDADWGSVAVWAWAMHRAVDFLMTQAWADKARIAAMGHSRLGKAVLLAGALDERIALTVPHQSGCGGTQSYRFCGKERNGKEGLAELTAKFPHWMHPNLSLFAGRVEKLPFDQHFVMALVAPRALLDNNAQSDPCVTVDALAPTRAETQKVYAFLGAPERFGFHFRPGKHEVGAIDWQIILDFCDKQLLGKKVDRRFDQAPAAPK